MAVVIALMVAIVTVAAINRHRLAGLGEPSIWALMRRCWRLLSVASLIGFWRGHSRNALLAIVRNWVLAIRDRIDSAPAAPYRRAGLWRVDSRRRNCCDVA